MQKMPLKLVTLVTIQYLVLLHQQLVAVVEALWHYRLWRSAAADRLLRLMVPMVVGAAMAVVIALNIRFATQIALAAGFGVWHWWWLRRCSWPSWLHSW